MDKLTAVLAHLAQQLGQAAAHNGPQAMHLAGYYLQLHAIFSLLGGFFALLFALALIYALYRVGSKIDFRYADPPHLLSFFLVGCIITFVISMACLITLFDAAIWISAFSPQLALAAKAMRLVGG